MFYYTFSVINTTFVPCTALLYDSTAAIWTLKLSTAPLSISCGIHLMSSLVCGLFSRTLFFRYPPSENSHVGWDLGNRMTRSYRFDAKWVCPMGSYAWGIQVFSSKTEAAPHFSNRALEYFTRNLHFASLNDSFCTKLITPGHHIPKISICLTICWGGYLKDKVCENNPHTRKAIIKREIKWIPQEMLNGAVDNFNVRVASVLSYSSAVHGTNIVFITKEV